MLICYVPRNFQKTARAIIAKANEIIDAYKADGYDLTIRQLYYQFVAQDLIPNTQRMYGKLKSVINDARLAGLVDWEAIVDRTRTYEERGHWSSPASLLYSAAKAYARDTRDTQDDYIEVWIEKDALIGVVERVCREHDVGYLSQRGYISQSAMWRAAQRFIEKEDEGKETFLIQLSDHDPSGIDMTRDIQTRFHLLGSSAIVERVALTMDQVNQYNPPPNPAKTTDARFADYNEKFGGSSWELDALDLRVLNDIIEDAIMGHTIKTRRNKLIKQQEKERQQIIEMADEFDS